MTDAPREVLLQKLQEWRNRQPEASEETQFNQYNMFQYLCEPRMILDLFKRDIITMREGEFLASVGRYALISDKQADWLRNIEMRAMAASAQAADR